ncbi:serine--tRNA ligase [Candidatus Babeliales bacterium]|nr:serine--tRNA ligase [Candidatus Babeliales bacterium]
MIDMALLREHPEKFGQLIKRKSPDFDIKKLLELDVKVRDVKALVEALRQKKNDLASQAKSGVTSELREASIAVGKDLKAQEQEQEQIEKAFKEIALSCPNIPFEDVPLGDKEENVVVREYGVKPTFSFPIKNHLELGEQNKWFNLEAATKMAASNFIFYQGEAVKMMYGLAMFMLKNNSRQGFEPVIPPYVANEETLTVSGNFPKFKEEVFSVPEDNLYLIPTSEVCLANLYRDEIIAGTDLPLKMTSWTSCFRREAGNYGKIERGLIRIHQFEKVELFAISRPEKSEETLEEMVDCAETILKKLGLHYRVSLLAAQDCSFQSAKTYDIEVWLPGQNRYYEVSSASNCTDFQSRRGKIRYRDSQDEKTQLVHTLNASSLALPRLMVALMETYQQADGTIALPEVLKNEMF